MSRDLEAAYRATGYEIEAPGGTLTLRVDQPSPALAQLHREHGVRCSAYLSAANPGSRPLGPEANATAHQRLLAALRAAGHAFVEGWGRDPGGAWPAERSVWVAGLGRDAALALARDFGQNAIVHAGPDAVPRLLWTRDVAGRG